MNWIYFIGLSVLGYICISIFGRLVGPDSTSAINALMSTFKPLPLTIVMLGNAALGVALYFGFLSTQTAIPVAIAIGAVTSFIFSVTIVGAELTLMRIAGLGFIIVGMYLLR